MPETKVCRWCSIEKPISEFYPATPAVDGSPRWHPQCKQCRAQYAKDNAERMNATARARRAKDPEAQRQIDRATYQRRRDKELERGRKRRATKQYQDRQNRWRAEKADHLREYDRERAKDPDYVEIKRAASQKFAREKPERVRELSRKSRQRHLLTRRQMEAARRAADPEKFNARIRAWKKVNWEQLYAYAHARRALLKGNGGRYEARDIAEIRARQNDLCAICKTSLNGRGERDHIVPPCYGGTNDPWNIQLTCDGPSSCNKKKSDTHPIIFMLRVRAGLVVLRSPPAKWAGRKAAE